MSARSRRRHRRTSRKRNPFLIALVLIVATGMLVTLGAGLYVLSVAAEAPTLSQLSTNIKKGGNSVIFAADGTRLGYIQSDEARTPVKYDYIPDDLQERNGRDRGRALLRPPRGRRRGSRPRRRREPQGRRDRSRAAPRSPCSSRATSTSRTQAGPRAQDQGGEDRHELEDAPLEGLDPRPLSEHRLLRDDQRAAPRSASRPPRRSTTRSRPRTSTCAAVRDARRAAPVALALQPAAQPARGAASAATRCSTRWQDQGYISAEEADAAEAAGPRAQAGQHVLDDPEPYFFDYVEQQLIEEYGVDTVRKGGLQGLHDDRSRAAGRRPRRDRRATSTTPTDPRPRWSRSTRITATCGRWPRAANTPTSSSTSRPRATASRGRPSRPSP